VVGPLWFWQLVVQATAVLAGGALRSSSGTMSDLVEAQRAGDNESAGNGQ